MPASFLKKSAAHFYAAAIMAASAAFGLCGLSAGAQAADTAAKKAAAKAEAQYQVPPANAAPQAYAPPEDFPPAPKTAAPGVNPARPYKGVCNSFWVRREAKIRFAEQMRSVPGEPRLQVKKFTNVAETQDVFGPETYDIDRRYCSATVIMNNGQSYPATYIVARNQGFAAIGGLHVSFCVEGLDKWLIRDNDCRSLRAPVNSVY